MIKQEYIDKIKTALKKKWEEFYDSFEHDYTTTTVPFGNTYVSIGRYPTEESVEHCLRSFQDEFSVEDFLKDIKETHGIEKTDEIKVFIVKELVKI